MCIGYPLFRDAFALVPRRAESNPRVGYFPGWVISVFRGLLSAARAAEFRRLTNKPFVRERKHESSTLRSIRTRLWVHHFWTHQQPPLQPLSELVRHARPLRHLCEDTPDDEGGLETGVGSDFH